MRERFYHGQILKALLNKQTNLSQVSLYMVFKNRSNIFIYPYHFFEYFVTVQFLNMVKLFWQKINLTE